MEKKETTYYIGGSRVNLLRIESISRHFHETSTYEVIMFSGRKIKVDNKEHKRESLVEAWELLLNNQINPNG